MNKIIYCSTACTEKTYSDLYGKQNRKPSPQTQKYHLVMLHGLSMQDEVPIAAVTKIPERPENGEKCIQNRIEKWNGIDIHYLARRYVPVIGLLNHFIESIRTLNRLTTEQSVVVVDVLNYSLTIAVSIVCKLRHAKMIGVVTDLPSKMSENPSKIQIGLSNFIYKQCDAFVVLTEDMNHEINKWGRPYLVIEGQVDSSMKTMENRLEDKDKVQVCLYAGSLVDSNGIMSLIKGFLMADIDNAELHIYGAGDSVAEIEEICKQNNKIKYMGCKMNHEVVEAQRKATLLINPRPINQKFVRYSFPSKNMEYMVSGTPMLTTRLPGMPKEYDDFVYFIDDETPEGICKALQICLKKGRDELHEKGIQAKEFVLKYKSDYVQANKIISLAKALQKDGCL